MTTDDKGDLSSTEGTDLAALPRPLLAAAIAASFGTGARLARDRAASFEDPGQPTFIGPSVCACGGEG